MSGSDRSHLTQSRFDEFKEWVKNRGGYIIDMPLPNHPYMVWRIRKYSRQGDHPDLFFYRRDRSDHITVPHGAFNLLAEWYKSKGQTSANIVKFQPRRGYK